MLAEFTKGQFFGEMSVLESLPRDADVVASGRTTVQVLGLVPCSCGCVGTRPSGWRCCTPSAGESAC